MRHPGQKQIVVTTLFDLVTTVDDVTNRDAPLSDIIIRHLFSTDSVRVPSKKRRYRARRPLERLDTVVAG